MDLSEEGWENWWRVGSRDSVEVDVVVVEAGLKEEKKGLEDGVKLWGNWVVAPNW